MANYSIERKNYSKFTAQIAKNVVKKKILEIRTRGARAADDLIDELIGKNKKGSKSSEFSPIKDKIIPIIEKNRAKWRNFIIEIAGRFDADALSVLGVNLIYGGLLTSSAGNVGWASVITVDNPDQRKLTEILANGRNRGNLVWILRGKETFSPETLKICRYFPECAFALVGDSAIDPMALSGLKNILILIKKGDKKCEKMNFPYILAGENDPIFDYRKEGSGNKSSLDLNSLPLSLIKFLEAPSFPICIDSLSEALGSVENLLSGGRRANIPYYFA